MRSLTNEGSSCRQMQAQLGPVQRTSSVKVGIEETMDSRNSELQGGGGRWGSSPTKGRVNPVRANS